VNFSEFASNVGGVAIKDWAVTSLNLSRVVKDNDLSLEFFGFFWWVVLGVTSNVSSSDFLNGDVLYVESDIVSWEGFLESFMMHFD